MFQFLRSLFGWRGGYYSNQPFSMGRDYRQNGNYGPPMPPPQGGFMPPNGFDNRGYPGEGFGGPNGGFGGGFGEGPNGPGRGPHR